MSSSPRAEKTRVESSAGGLPEQFRALRPRRLFDYFEGLIEPFPDGPTGTPPSKLLPFLWFFARECWPWMLVISVITVAIAILEISLFAFLGNLVDWLGNIEPSELLQQERYTLIYMAVIVLVIIPVLEFVHSLVLHQSILGNFPTQIRSRMHRHMLGQSYAFYQDEFAGRVATKVMQSALAVRETILKVLDVMVYAGVYFAGALVLVMSFDWRLMLPFVVWLVCYVALLNYFLPRMKTVSQCQADARSSMTGRIVDSYTNIVTVKLFAHARREERYGQEGFADFLDTVHPQMRLVSLLHGLLHALNALLLFSSAAIGISLWMHDAVSVGAVAVAVGLVLRLLGMSQWIMWETSSLFEHVGVVFDGMKMLAKPKAVVDTVDATPLEVKNGQVEFNRVQFNYGKTGGVIDDFSLTIDAGEKIGLVGRSGAGKTTLTNLLLRLYDVEAGSICIDGTDISGVLQESLRHNIGVVTQDTSLLHRSVRDNIAYGRPEVSDEDVIAAAQRANAHEFIVDLEDLQGRSGYEAHVGERGVKLSGGQRQRIAIARMFLKDAPILVLDEATSALDSEVESAIQENLDALMAGKTVIAIAHRLSTIAAMDRLVVLQEGKIVELGDHASLVANNGLYARLWERQSGGFLAEERAD